MPNRQDEGDGTGGNATPCGGSGGGDSSGGDSSGGGDGGDAGASAPEQTPKEAWDQAMRDFVNGKLNRDGLQAAANRYQCSLGVESKC